MLDKRRKLDDKYDRCSDQAEAFSGGNHDVETPTDAASSQPLLRLFK